MPERPERIEVRRRTRPLRAVDTVAVKRFSAYVKVQGRQWGLEYERVAGSRTLRLLTPAHVRVWSAQS